MDFVFKGLTLQLTLTTLSSKGHILSTTAQTNPILVDRIIPRSVVSDTVLVLAGIVLTSLSAQLQIPASPVPFTFQTLAVLLIGATYGSVRAAITISGYVLIGMLGLPVFAGGASGIEKLFGATGGFIFGFIFAAYLTGYLAEKSWSSNALKMFVSFTLGSIVIYAIGVPVLAMVAFNSDVIAATVAMFPYLIWDAVKAVIAAGFVPAVFVLVKKIKKN
jgi:biotin transport system substrate-specific component